VGLRRNLLSACCPAVCETEISSARKSGEYFYCARFAKLLIVVPLA